MTTPQELQKALHRSFTDAIAVRTVPCGYAISSPFYDNSGDTISFYAKDTDDGIVFEDDGAFLPHLIASGVDIETGQRRHLLDSILRDAGAYWDNDTFEIRSIPVDNRHAGLASAKFLSGLLRLKSLESLTRENIRSTFRDDATEAIELSLSDSFRIEMKAPLSRDLEEFPADIVLSPKSDLGRKLGLFLVTNATPLLEAELLHREIEKLGRERALGAVALIEDAEKISVIGSNRFQRAVNGGLPTRFFRGTEQEAISSFRKLSAA